MSAAHKPTVTPATVTKSTPPTRAAIARHVFKLAGDIAVDAATVRESLEGLMGNCGDDGCGDADNRLAAMAVMVGRMGLLADMLSRAHGGMPFRRDPMGWVLYSDDSCEALAAMATQGAS